MNKSGAHTTENSSEADRTFAAAARHYHAGELAAAEDLCDRVLALAPGHEQGLYMKGVIAYRQGRYADAVQPLRAAIATGRGDLPGYHKLLGDCWREQKNMTEAEAAYRAATALNPDHAEAWGSLGTACFFAGRLDEAEECYARVLVIDPGQGMALYNMGAIAERRGRDLIARDYYTRAVAARPDLAQAHNNLGNLARADGDDMAALGCYDRAIAAAPGFADAHFNRGLVLKEAGRGDEAVASFSRSAALAPRAEAYAHCGEILQRENRSREALAYYEKALALRPGDVDFLNNSGSACFKLRRYREAADYYRRALAFRPDSPAALNNLANALKAGGETEEAIVLYRRSLAARPGHAATYTNLMLAMIYARSVTPEELADAAREFGRTIADPLLPMRDFPNSRDPGRRLRIGYVSPDFRRHAVNYFFEHLLHNHDRAGFEVFGYANVQRPDEVTARLEEGFDHWRDIRALGDEDAAAAIMADGIDILVDMAGHTADSRLTLLARKPAPVQVSWLGYPATTGMAAMDYRITDPHAEPPGMTEHLNVEALWRLPDIFCCYGPPESGPRLPERPPRDDNGYITFGCFNNIAKVTDAVLRVWAGILARVPGSRLLLEVEGLEEFRPTLEERLRAAGIVAGAVMLEPRRPENQYVLYNRVDIALDPFPCNGGTTSMDALWMGVPFVALAGRHFASRMGVSFLSNAELGELVAANEDEYIEKAASLASDPESLRALRSGLRERVSASPAMDRARFARALEEAYRGMWKKWCAQA